VFTKIFTAAAVVDAAIRGAQAAVELAGDGDGELGPVVESVLADAGQAAEEGEAIRHSAMAAAIVASAIGTPKTAAELNAIASPEWSPRVRYAAIAATWYARQGVTG
jgi:hypothetical protein